MFDVLDFGHRRGGWKIKLGFFRPKYSFFFFSLKTFNKHIYNVINQLKIPLNLSKTIKSIRK
jgi:hypothetical protein